MEIKEWTKEFIKHKDILSKKLKGIEEVGNRLICDVTDHKHSYFISPILNEKAIEFLSEEGKKSIVCSSSKINVDFIVNNWKVFANHDLFVIFVDIRNNKRLIINPKVHNMISDDETLETGLRTMFDSTFQPQSY